MNEIGSFPLTTHKNVLKVDCRAETETSPGKNIGVNLHEPGSSKFIRSHARSKSDKRKYR